MLAEGCVESHARDAVENGYRPIVISDATASTSEELLAASFVNTRITHSKTKNIQASTRLLEIID